MKTQNEKMKNALQSGIFLLLICSIPASSVFAQSATGSVNSNSQIISDPFLPESPFKQFLG